MTIDIRNRDNIELGRLKNTEHLSGSLPLRAVTVQPKLDGQRYTLQLGPDGTFMVSRSRHGKTKGVEESRSNPYCVIDLPPSISQVYEDHDGFIDFPNVILDGELVTVGISCASGVSRSDTVKKFVVFDAIYVDSDIRDLPYSERLDLAKRIVEAIDSPSIEMIPSQNFDEFNELAFNTLMETIKETGVEGFVIKPVNTPYSKNGYGWKLKLKDTCDGVVMGFNEEKKHTLGVVTRTGRVGSVQVGWYKPSTLPLAGPFLASVAWVSLPEDSRCPLHNGEELLVGRVVEFAHLGWDGKAFRFPQFVRWRDGEKSASDCVWEDSKTKVKIEKDDE